MLSQAMHKEHEKLSNVAYTDNGAKAFASTLNANLDFYARCGNVAHGAVIADFENAFSEDQDLALRNILKMRDVRGGHGVRENYRKVLRHLAQNHISVITETDILERTVEVGRWDDIYSLLDLNMPTVQNLIVKLVARELNKGAENSLVAKWLPINSRKSHDQKFLSQLRAYMKLTPKELRNKVVAQRKELVEVKMSAGRFKDIVYSHVPSRAMSVYRKAFRKHDPEGMAVFLEKAVKGEVKVNASTIYPHEVTRKLRGDENDIALAEAQWKNLPDYLKGNSRVLPMVDVSGSMGTIAYGTHRCIDISVALGIYIADRNKSVFKDLLITFSEVPTFVSLASCSTLAKKFDRTHNATWGYSTNLESAFEAVLDLALKHKVPQEDLPEYLLVLTDMQYNASNSGCDTRIMKELKSSYKKAGYKLPKVIWWNIQGSSGSKTTPVTFDKEGTAIVSGSSPALLEAVLSGDLDSYTPLNVMLADLSNDRYKVTYKSGG